MKLICLLKHFFEYIGKHSYFIEIHKPFQFETSRYEGTSILQIFVIYPLCISIVASWQTKLRDESATALTKICSKAWWYGHRHQGRWEGRKALPAGNPVKLWDFTPRRPNLSLLRRPQRIIIDPIAHFGKEWQPGTQTANVNKHGGKRSGMF